MADEAEQVQVGAVVAVRVAVRRGDARVGDQPPRGLGLRVADHRAQHLARIDAVPHLQAGADENVGPGVRDHRIEGGGEGAGEHHGRQPLGPVRAQRCQHLLVEEAAPGQPPVEPGAADPGDLGLPVAGEPPVEEAVPLGARQPRAQQVAGLLVEALLLLGGVADGVEEEVVEVEHALDGDEGLVGVEEGDADGARFHLVS